MISMICCFKKIIPANDGGFIACGDSIIHCNDTWDIILMKFDQEGDTIWTREYVTGKQK